MNWSKKENLWGFMVATEIKKIGRKLYVEHWDRNAVKTTSRATTAVISG